MADDGSHGDILGVVMTLLQCNGMLRRGRAANFAQNCDQLEVSGGVVQCAVGSGGVDSPIGGIINQAFLMALGFIHIW